MSHYYSLGKIPAKRHIQFRSEKGELYHEQLVSTEGFSDKYSLVYHIYPPTRVLKIDTPYSVAPEIADSKNMQHRSFQGFSVKPKADFLESRTYMLVNSDVYIALAAPKKGTENYFYKNSQAHELIFVHEGSGTLTSIYGALNFRSGDHIVVPMGVIFEIKFETENNRLFIVESKTAFRFPKRYMNRYGQLMEDAPYCERDIKKPSELITKDEEGDFLVKIKNHDQIYPYHYASHPFDVVGWDGYYYPFVFSIHDFEPITGRLHMPPPIHQTFETAGFVMCAFVPRLYDYHPLSIPTPYNHSNVESDEVLYYVEGEFMSRKHVERGQITLHPIGIPHGPHPGAVEKSIGAKETNELAVMVDTFKPLFITKQAFEIEEPEYYKSWVE